MGKWHAHFEPDGELTVSALKREFGAGAARVRASARGHGPHRPILRLLLSHVLCIRPVHGYLLVAMPQSSSTSAMESLGAMGCLRAMSSQSSKRACRSNGTLQTDPIWKVLADEHSHICQQPAALLRLYSSSNSTVYKDHVLPTQQSISALLAARMPVVVLLRKPVASLHGWCERRLREGWQLSMVTERAAARFAALVAYDRAWRQAIKSHAGRFSLVEYERMQSQGRGATIGAMLAAWKVPACRSFSDSTVRLVNASTTECCRVVSQVEPPTPSTAAPYAACKRARLRRRLMSMRRASLPPAVATAASAPRTAAATAAKGAATALNASNGRCDPRARRLLLIGNGPSVLNYRLGRTIDSFFNVVRFNEYQTSDGLEAHVGRKTQHWVINGANTAELMSAYPNRTAPILVALPISRGNKSYAYLRRAVEAQMTSSQHRERVAFVSEATARSLARSLDAGPSHVPSSGLTAIWHFTQTCPLVHIHGFDFFDKSIAGVHYFDDGVEIRQTVRHHNGPEERRLVNELVSAGRVQLLSSCIRGEAALAQSGVASRRPVAVSRITKRAAKLSRQAAPSAVHLAYQPSLNVTGSDLRNISTLERQLTTADQCRGFTRQALHTPPSCQMTMATSSAWIRSFAASLAQRRALVSGAVSPLW